MPVQSRYIEPEKPQRTIDWSMALGKFAMWAAFIPFGILWWGVNGGFSVIGLSDFAASFGDYGKLFYTIVVTWTFKVPFKVTGLTLPAIQPVFPWGMVAAGSLLQVVIFYRTLRKKSVPIWMFIAGVLLSIYDVGTTYFGLATLQWVREAGPLIQLGIAPVLTFGLEILVGFLLRPGTK